MIKIDTLGKQYGHVWFLKDVNIHISEGSAVGLLGANGAGKSTLIKAILNLIHPSAGTIAVGGETSYVPEQPRLPSSMSARSLLIFKCNANCIPVTNVATALADVKLSAEDAERPVRQYSKGMQQRTSLAFALCGDPKILLLDEPMSGLDALGRADILALLKHRKEMGMTIFMSSHIVSDMVQLCDSVFIMAHGNICESQPIKHHSLAEAKALETRLAYWTEQQHA